MSEDFVYEVPVSSVERAGRDVRTVGDLEILIVDTPRGIRAYSGVCPHLGGPLLEADVSPERIRCPWHRYEFDAATGRCLTAPGFLKLAGAGEARVPEPCPLSLKPLDFEIVDGRVRVRGPR